MFRLLLPRLIALLTFLFMLVMNALATTLPLNGQSTNEISDRYDTLFAPIGFTFAIWGIIYLTLGVYTVVQLVADNALIRQIQPSRAMHSMGGAQVPQLALLTHSRRK